jgi:hypothetical protein
LVRLPQQMRRSDFAIVKHDSCRLAHVFAAEALENAHARRTSQSAEELGCEGLAATRRTSRHK